MDANVAPTLWGTAKNIYRQHRRWTYGAENIAYILFAFLKNPRIPFGKKVRALRRQGLIPARITQKHGLTSFCKWTRRM